MSHHVFRIMFLAGGSGIGTRGFLRSRVNLGGDTASFVNCGSVDIDPEACRDYQYLTGKPALCRDLHEMTPAELRAYCPVCPDVVFSSSPCTGFSRLLPTDKSKEAKYQRLNELVFRSVFLACETWGEPPPMFALENVPGITSPTRGKDVLDRAKRILHAYRYFLHEGFHDCGEIGNLAQHRKRYLLVARRPSSIRAFVHKPPKFRVRACGEVLSEVPVPIGPEGAEAGLMHRMPNIQWDTWVKLALIPPGGDWRDLPPRFSLGVDGSKFKGSPGLYKVVDDHGPWPTVTATARIGTGNAAAAVADRRVRKFNGNILGVVPFTEPIGVVGGESLPTNGRYSVADPRLTSPLKPGQRRREVHGRFDVRPWSEPARTVAGTGSNGGYGVADPRPAKKKKGRFVNNMQVRDWEQPTLTVTSATRPDSGATCVADPRIAVTHRANRFSDQWKVREWTEPAGAVTGATDSQCGAQHVADPRPKKRPRNETLGVMSWDEAARAVLGSGDVQNSRCALGDPRKPGKAPLPIIISKHATWNRPITTLELAMLQGLPPIINGKPLQLSGQSTLGWRMRIGNGVPEGAGWAMGNSFLMALLASTLGTWSVSDEGIWVRDRDHYVMPEAEAYVQ